MTDSNVTLEDSEEGHLLPNKSGKDNSGEGLLLLPNKSGKDKRPRLGALAAATITLCFVPHKHMHRVRVFFTRHPRPASYSRTNT